MRDIFGRYITGHRENAHRPRDKNGRWLETNDRFNIVSLTDWHVPFHDHNAVVAALRFVESVQPNIIILHELHDFYSLSKFDKNPDRINSLQYELDEVTHILEDLRHRCSNSRIILLKSNHLDRLKRYLWTQAPALNSLRALEIPALLGLGRLDIEYMEYFIYGGYIFKHGDLVSRDAGMTARREMQIEGMSGISGHTHRLASMYHRDRSGTRCWIESGCLCDLNPEYMEGRLANWQHGLSIVSFSTTESFALALPITAGKVPMIKDLSSD